MPASKTSKTHPFAPLVDVLRERHEQLVTRAVAATVREIPVYAALDRATLDEVRANIAYDVQALGRLFDVGGAGTGFDERMSSAAGADRDHLRSVAGRRARGGVPLADFLHAYRVSQRVIWQELRVSAAGDGRGFYDDDGASTGSP